VATLPDARGVDRVRSALLAWYATDHRDFPWRGTLDPYAVLVSEVMLQQTQAARVAERFPPFMRRFPNAESLATAPTAAVLAEWSGLGYNRRALSLRRAAATVAERGWPRDIEGLMALPGVGPYTARAVASLAFGIPAGVVDTNVRRWLVRRFNVADAPRALQVLADALARSGTGAEVMTWTHATMEFGADVCRARRPRCMTCPIADGCPSRDIIRPVPVTRQAALRGSRRAYRGAAVRMLGAADGNRMTSRALRAGLAADAGRIGPAVDDRDWERLLAGLERDGLIHRSGGFIGLGTATIGE